MPAAEQDAANTTQQQLYAAHEAQPVTRHTNPVSIVPQLPEKRPRRARETATITDSTGVVREKPAAAVQDTALAKKTCRAGTVAFGSSHCLEAGARRGPVKGMSLMMAICSEAPERIPQKRPQNTQEDTFLSAK